MHTCINYTLKCVQFLFFSDVGSAEGLAFDPVYKDLYWTSYTNSSISRIRVYRKDSKPEKIVLLGTKDHPRAIVLDSCNS